MAESKAGSRVWADREIPGEGFLRDAVRVGAANLLMVLCAWIAIPLPWTPVPVTGQTFGVMLVAALLGSRRGAIMLGLYLLEGLAGLPVFQPFGLPGAARLAGPTAGYLLSYPVAAFVIGWLVERQSHSEIVQQASAQAVRQTGNTSSLALAPVLRLVAALLAGELVVFTGGCAWLATGFGLGWPKAVAVGAMPFVAGELIKMVLVVVAVRGVESANHRD